MATCKKCDGHMVNEGEMRYDEPDTLTSWEVFAVVCVDCGAIGVKAFHGERPGVTRLTRNKDPWVAGNATTKGYDTPPWGDESPPREIVEFVSEVA